MTKFITQIARISAILGGIVLTALAILMTISIIGGGIAKFANSDLLANLWPSFAMWLQNTGIRTIPAMYEIMEIGIAFVIFSFLPIASLYRGHAVVDVFTDFLNKNLNGFLKAFWETVFFIVLLLITWRLYLGMERLMSNGTVLIELHIPAWWGYAVAFVQMILATIVSLYSAVSEWVRVFGGPNWLPETEGAVH